MVEAIAVHMANLVNYLKPAIFKRGSQFESLRHFYINR